MAPLIILLAVFFILYLINRYALKSHLSISVIGRIALAAMLIATGVTHFTNTDLMVATMPDLLPAKRELVYFTGVLELLAVVGLLSEKTAKITSVMLIIFFLVVLPANILGSFRRVELGGMQYGPLYLLFRIPLQAFFIWWAWYFGIKRNRER